MTMTAPWRVWVLAITLFAVCAAYFAVSIFAPETATALGVLYISVLLTVALVIRVHRR